VGETDRWHVHNMAELVHQLTRHQPWYVRWVADRRIESMGQEHDHAGHAH
jgi:hypothetical protein